MLAALGSIRRSHVVAASVGFVMCLVMLQLLEMGPRAMSAGTGSSTGGGGAHTAGPISTTGGSHGAPGGGGGGGGGGGAGTAVRPVSPGTRVWHEPDKQVAAGSDSAAGKDRDTATRPGTPSFPAKSPGVITLPPQQPPPPPPLADGVPPERPVDGVVPSSQAGGAGTVPPSPLVSKPKPTAAAEGPYATQYLQCTGVACPPCVARCPTYTAAAVSFMDALATVKGLSYWLYDQSMWVAVIKGEGSPVIRFGAAMPAMAPSAVVPALDEALAGAGWRAQDSGQQGDLQVQYTNIDPTYSGIIIRVTPFMRVQGWQDNDVLHQVNPKTGKLTCNMFVSSTVFPTAMCRFDTLAIPCPRRMARMLSLERFFERNRVNCWLSTGGRPVHNPAVSAQLKEGGFLSVYDTPRAVWDMDAHHVGEGDCLFSIGKPARSWNQQWGPVAVAQNFNDDALVGDGVFQNQCSPCRNNDRTARLPCAAQAVLQNDVLKPWMEVAKQLDLLWWMNGGTLLAVSRDGCLNGDDDLDVAVLYFGGLDGLPELEQRLDDALMTQRGWRRQPKGTRGVLRYDAPVGKTPARNGADLDVHLDLHVMWIDEHGEYIAHENVIPSLSERPTGWVIPAQYIFPLRWCRWRSVVLPCPNRPLHLLLTDHNCEYGYKGCLLQPVPSYKCYDGDTESIEGQRTLVSTLRLAKAGYVSMAPLVKDFIATGQQRCPQFAHEIPDVTDDEIAQWYARYVPRQN